MRIKIPELLFNPSLNESTSLSVQDILWESIKQNDLALRSELMNSITISGGSTMFSGFADRLKSEIEQLAPSGAEIKVIDAANRKYCSWRGASSLASLASFESSWIHVSEYEEIGP